MKPRHIALLNLEKHIEGGYFAQVYKSEDTVLVNADRYRVTSTDNDETTVQGFTKRSAGTSIYFLLEKNDFSAWHRLTSDEVWHYYDGGSPIDIHIIDKYGVYKLITLGNPCITENSSFQHVIKAGCWFAAEVRDKASFALVGCTVSPGFEYQDFELANRKTLSSEYPEHAGLINKFTRLDQSS